MLILLLILDCLCYTLPTAYMRVLVYVGDVIVIGPSLTAIQRLISSLNVSFSLKDLENLNFVFETRSCQMTQTE